MTLKRFILLQYIMRITGKFEFNESFNSSSMKTQLFEIKAC